MSIKFYIAFGLIGLGVLFGILESVLYGHVDENNVLQESLFLPLSFLFVFLGMLGLLLLGTGKVFRKMKTNDT